MDAPAGPKNKKPLVFFVLFAALLVFAGFFIFRMVKSTKNAASSTYRVLSETFTNVIEIAGTVSAAKEQNLQAAGAGTVTAVFVKEGDFVKKNQVILQLEDGEQRYNLSNHDFQTAQKRVSGSPREIELMLKQREVLLQRIQDRRILANFDGLIAQFQASAGDVVEAKDVAGVIIDRSYLKAVVEIVETDAPKLAAGQRVSLSFPASGERVIEGFVHSFPAVAVKSSRGASVVKAEIRVYDPPDFILPNYSFTGEIEISPPVTMLLVEREAIALITEPLPQGSGASPQGPGGQTARGPGVGASPQGPGGGGPAAGARGERERGRGGEPGPQTEAFPRAGRSGPDAGAPAYAEKVVDGGKTVRVDCVAAPYGRNFFRIISGLSEGDELKALREKPVSGQNRKALQEAARPAGPGGDRNARAAPGGAMMRF
ncbi:MAG: HlyD family efflux transporter periplasmic adaptor subunit [Spirochaetaceae bacterium]|jgi:multidrug efflux pump subunit AcrA (membrane-fusion protein)|nr:HlyD family efflux transporter periplasmic adaptor subunit [Spirochaetaceae bacterium]